MRGRKRFGRTSRRGRARSWWPWRRATWRCTTCGGGRAVAGRAWPPRGRLHEQEGFFKISCSASSRAASCSRRTQVNLASGSSGLRRRSALAAAAAAIAISTGSRFQGGAGSIAAPAGRSFRRGIAAPAGRSFRHLAWAVGQRRARGGEEVEQPTLLPSSSSFLKTEHGTRHKHGDPIRIFWRIHSCQGASSKPLWKQGASWHNRRNPS